MVIFIADGSVHWPLAIPMIASAMAGGWAGATWARRLDKRLVRKIVILIGVTLTAWYFSQMLAGRKTGTPPAEISSPMIFKENPQ
jgi:uncharacterized membrane protein YfcA